MKKYFVENIRNAFERPHEVQANTPLEAVKKVYPDCKASRDMTNTGDIVVGNWHNGYYGAVYKRYVYNIERIEQ
jgi:hypothetical protein